MKLTLTYCPGACSLIPYILLTEAGDAFDTRPVNLGQGKNTQPDTSAFTHCVAHRQRMEQRPSVQQLLAYEAQVQDTFAAAARS